MNLVFVAVAIASRADKCSCMIGIRAMDGGSADLAGSKYLPGMYLRRATAANTEFMSGVIAMRRLHLPYFTLNNLTYKLMGRQ